MNIERFTKNPGLLVDLCREVIAQIDVVPPASEVTPEWAAMEVQLREIAKTIDRLERINVPIPDVLRAEKTRLAAALGMQEESARLLEQLADAFSSVVRDIRIRLNNRRPQARPWIGQAETLNLDRLSRSELRSSIIRALESLGGRAPMKHVFQCMETDLQGKLTPSDLAWLEGTKRYSWQEAARGEREKMIRDGILRSASPMGIWELSEEHS